jgi:sulfonate transport system substrate-binding protein
VLTEKGWLEEALHGTAVDWVLSLGSNKANQYLAAGAIQFGSTAGSAALLARTNGTPIRTVFLYTQPEWTALVVRRDSPLNFVHDLKGKRVAATRGTDPWFFLLRSLHEVGLNSSDIELVDVQHPDGRLALERGQVDAWAGLDPHMAASQLDAGSVLLYRNVNFNTFGALNAREDFLGTHPEIVATVLKQYERARVYAHAHPQETERILAQAASIEPRVAAVEVAQRTRYPSPVPGDAYERALRAVIPILHAENIVASSADPDRALAGLLDPRFAQVALAGG